jgi:REP element-mobilizing transposase RayT
MTPTAAVREIILGVLGRAQARYGMEIHAPVFMSNHFHLLVTIRDQLQMARFMGFVNSNLAREIGQLVGWRDKFWSRRYDAIPVSEEEAAQVERLRYLLSHGVKEGLVFRPEDWPGVHPAAPLLGKSHLEGTWFDRSRDYEARRSGKPASPRAFATRETVVLSPLPCWRHLSDSQRTERIRDLIGSIEEGAEAERRATDRRPLGADAVYHQHPHSLPEESKRSPAPLIHAVSREVREKFRAAYREFTMQFREASRKLRSGDLTARFPEGSFPPSLSWVPFPNTC